MAKTYYSDPRSPESFTDDGWLRTGDVAGERRGYIRLVDRTKDVVKSGGGGSARWSWRTRSWPTPRWPRRP
ncbi:MAG: AMP-binding protein [Acidimicrobiales bacterium]